MQIQSNKEEVSNIRLINMNGMQVAKRSVTLQPGDNIVILKDLESIPAGVYLMEIRTADEIITQKIIKN